MLFMFSELIIKALPYQFNASQWQKVVELALREHDVNNNKLNMHQFILPQVAK